MQLRFLFTLVILLHTSQSRPHHHHSNGTDSGGDNGGGNGGGSSASNGANNGAGQTQSPGILDCVEQGVTCISTAISQDSTLAKLGW